MNRFLLIGFALLISGIITAQTEVALRFEHLVGDEDFELNTEFTESDQGYNFSITRLQYYIAEIEITHDGGQVTPIEETWLLVDASSTSDFDLGEHNISNIEGISYWIGVDPDHNHLDPTQYPEGHPLAPQNPVMHWGWAAGYRFVCLEGKTGMNLILTYQIHALGDNNYHQVSLETGAFVEDGKLIIPVLADYMGLYEGIDVSVGLIEHSEYNEAADLLQNFSTNVFAPTYFVGVEEEIFEGAFSVGPNPATDGFSNVYLDLPPGYEYRLNLMDINGRVLDKHVFNNGKFSQKIEPGKPGIYFIQLLQDQRVVSTQKLIITQ